MIEELVILVNEKDEKIGLMPKMEAHEKGILHRAFSIFILNSNKLSPQSSINSNNSSFFYRTFIEFIYNFCFLFL